MNIAHIDSVKVMTGDLNAALAEQRVRSRCTRRLAMNTAATCTGGGGRELGGKRSHVSDER